MPETDDVTDLLRLWREGDEAAAERLFSAVHSALRRIAALHFRRERSAHTLQPTALVNEAFLRLVDQREHDWQNRQHFYAVASKMMRRVLADHARRRKAEKRGGFTTIVPLDQVDAAAASAPRPIDYLALDRALDALESEEPLQAKIVELRHFGGLTLEEVAEHLAVPLITVKRKWQLARARLMLSLQDGAA